MPFTPFHFGVGLAAKAGLGRVVSLALFVALQVVIDLESLANLVRERYPVHRFWHTFAGATLLAFLATGLVGGVLVGWARRTGRRDWPAGRVFALVLGNALFATWSHVVLDAIMHRDVRPFAPWTDSNPLLGLVGTGPLHLACAALGFFGLVVLAMSWSLPQRDR